MNKRMPQKPILSRRIGEWAYALVEYNLACESLKFMRGQIVSDFIVEHWINDENELGASYITCTSWKLFFDGSACDNGQEVGVILISLSGTIFEFSNQLERKTHE